VNPRKSCECKTNQFDLLNDHISDSKTRKYGSAGIHKNTTTKHPKTVEKCNYAEVYKPEK
jgi:hypothetical protein